MATVDAHPKPSGVAARKLAGIPIWVWGTVLVGGLVFGAYLRRKGQGATPAATVTPSFAGSENQAPAVGNGTGGGGIADAFTGDAMAALVAQSSAFAQALTTSEGNFAYLAAQESQNSSALASAALGAVSQLGTSALGLAGSSIASAFNFAQTFNQGATLGGYGGGSGPVFVSSPPAGSAASGAPAPSVPAFGTNPGTGTAYSGGASVGHPNPPTGVAPPINVNVNPASSYVPAAITHKAGSGPIGD